MTTKKETDSRIIPLRDDLARMYEEINRTPYVHTYGKDGMALKRLLQQATPEQIKAAWVRGLTTAVDFDRVYNFAELAGKYTRLVAKPAGNPAIYKEPPPPKDEDDPKTAPFGACVVCGKGAWVQTHLNPFNQPVVLAALCGNGCTDDQARAKLKTPDLRQVTP